MAYTIAVAGKGGVGKTTFCGLLIDYLCKKRQGAVLAVDADANSNLNEVLGVDVDITLGEVREEIAHDELTGESRRPTGMSKQDYMNFRFGDALIEEDDYDLLVMGRTQGQGCYCFVNGILQSQLNRYADNYKYLVVDNEAGMEHISRGLLPHVDMLLLISDGSRRGVQAVGRIAKLADDLNIGAEKVGLIVNRAPGGVPGEGVMQEIADQNLELIGVLPQDQTVYDYDSDGKPTVRLPDDSPFRLAFNEIMKKLGL